MKTDQQKEMKARFLVPGSIVCILALNKIRTKIYNKPIQVTYKRVTNEQEGLVSGNSSKVTVLVTGGCGALGSSLLAHLVEDGGYKIHSLDVRIPTNQTQGVSSYISTDITNEGDVERALKETKPEAVFHVAALLPRIGIKDSEFHRVNTEGTRMIVNACKRMGVSRLVYTSSCSVILSKKPCELYDVKESFPLPDTSPHAYSESKIKGERIVLEANGEDIVTCVLRASGIIGPTTAFMESLSGGNESYFGDGGSRQPLVGIEDMSRAFILAEKKLRGGLDSVVSGQVYNITGGSPTFKELAEFAIQVNGNDGFSSTTPKRIPISVAKMMAWTNLGMHYLTGFCFHEFIFPSAIRYSLCSSTLNGEKAKRELGFEPKEDWQVMIERHIREFNKNKRKNL